MASLGAAHNKFRRPNESLIALEEAVNLCRKLADARPDRYQADLAHALATLGTVLQNAGRYGNALTAYEESRTLYMIAASERPSYDAEANELDRRIRKVLNDRGREDESINFRLDLINP